MGRFSVRQQRKAENIMTQESQENESKKRMGSAEGLWVRPKALEMDKVYDDATLTQKSPSSGKEKQWKAGKRKKLNKGYRRSVKKGVLVTPVCRYPGESQRRLGGTWRGSSWNFVDEEGEQRARKI